MALRNGIYSESLVTSRFGGNGYFEEAPPAEEQTETPEPGERTGPQSWLGNYDYDAAGYGSKPGANGDCPDNPCGFPAYGQLYLGSYWVYDWMLQQPHIAHARAELFDAVIGTPWGYEARKGTPDQVLNFAREVMEELRPELVPDALRGVDYGWAAFEKVWKVVKRRMRLVRVKPLAWNGTRLLRDRYGNFAGLEGWWDRDWLGVHKSWLYTHDMKAGKLHGRSRLENLRATAWRDWLDAATDLFKLCRNKLSGIMGVIYHPSGTYKGADGKEKSWRDYALRAAQNFRDGAVVILNHMGPGAISADTDKPAGGVQNFDQLVKLIEAQAVRLEKIDFGDNSPAVAAILDRMRHAEESFYHGYLRSPRTGMESKNGSRADSQQHTDTADLNAENLNDSLARAVNKGILDDLLTVNFGEEMAGAVRVKPARMSDEHREVDLKIIDAALADDSARPQLLEKYIDLTAIFSRQGVAIIEGEKIELDAVDATGGDGDNTSDGQSQDQTQG